jgi:ankyrin repeat protein
MSLITAYNNNDIELVKLLVKNGANLKECDENGLTILML